MPVRGDICLRATRARTHRSAIVRHGWIHQRADPARGAAQADGSRNSGRRRGRVAYGVAERGQCDDSVNCAQVPDCYVSLHLGTSCESPMLAGAHTTKVVVDVPARRLRGSAALSHPVGPAADARTPGIEARPALGRSASSPRRRGADLPARPHQESSLCLRQSTPVGFAPRSRALPDNFACRRDRSFRIWCRRWSVIFCQPRLSSRVRRQPRQKPVRPSKAHMSMQGDLAAMAQAAAGFGFTSTVTCDSPLKRLSAA